MSLARLLVMNILGTPALQEHGHDGVLFDAVAALDHENIRLIDSSSNPSAWRGRRPSCLDCGAQGFRFTLRTAHSSGSVQRGAEAVHRIIVGFEQPSEQPHVYSNYGPTSRRQRLKSNS